MGAPYGGIDMITDKPVGRDKGQSYDDWLMEMVIKYGIGQTIETIISETWFIEVALGIEHMTGNPYDSLGKWNYKLTDKAHRYLEMLENYDRLLNTLHERNE